MGSVTALVLFGPWILQVAWMRVRRGARHLENPERKTIILPPWAGHGSAIINTFSSVLFA